MEWLKINWLVIYTTVFVSAHLHLFLSATGEALVQQPKLGYYMPVPNNTYRIPQWKHVGQVSIDRYLFRHKDGKWISASKNTAHKKFRSRSATSPAPFGIDWLVILPNKTWIADPSMKVNRVDIDSGKKSYYRTSKKKQKLSKVAALRSFLDQNFTWIRLSQGIQKSRSEAFQVQ